MNYTMERVLITQNVYCIWQNVHTAPRKYVGALGSEDSSWIRPKDFKPGVFPGVRLPRKFRMITRSPMPRNKKKASILWYSRGRGCVGGFAADSIALGLGVDM